MYTPQRAYRQPGPHPINFDDRIGRLGNYVNNDYNNNNVGVTKTSHSASKVPSSNRLHFNKSTKSQELEDNRLFNSRVPKNNSDQNSEWRSDISQLCNLVSIKSNIGVENRRYGVPRQMIYKFNQFYRKIQSMHQLDDCAFNIYYSDQDGERLPINNDDNLAKAIDATNRIRSTHHIVLNSSNIPIEYNPNLSLHNHYMHQVQQIIIKRPYLKLYLERKGILNDQYYLNSNTVKCKRRENLINMFIPVSNSSSDSRPRIGMPEDFRQVSSIIDANILPATRRRVVLRRGGSDKPLGFYIRDGTYTKMNSQGVVEKNYGIFISRLVPGGLAESTNLLAVNDEILEVNGIEVGKNKRLDQVRDMMVANSSNLIITIQPAKSQRVPNRQRTRHVIAHGMRDRLPSNQSMHNELTEDMIRHHIN